jgi:hypothetical protein
MAGSMNRLSTGQINFAGGANSGVVPVVANDANPTGLKSTQVAWLQSATVRQAGISPRNSYQKRATLPLLDLFQGGYMYDPLDSDPYLMLLVGGRTFRVRVDTNFAIDEVTINGDPNPATEPLAHFVQGEQFLVIQAGDLTTLPMFWDGSNMTRSRGLTTSIVSEPSFTVPAIGSVVLVNLGAPYGGEINEIVTINGFRYRQIDPNQKYDWATVVESVSPPYSQGELFDWNGVAGDILANPSNPAYPATVLSQTVRGRYGSPFLTEPPLPGVEIPSTIYLTGTTIVPATSYYVYNITYGFFPEFGTPKTAVAKFNFTPNPLAAPGANQVWLMNLDDTREGTVIDPAANPPQPGQLPSAESMDYYMGRIFLAAGREYVAGDIVGGPSGTGIYGFTDSILQMTENTYTVGGGAFIVPSQAGNIRALAHAANLDSALGEGQLKVFTRKSVYSVNVTPNRADWATLSEPLQRVEQINFGAVSDRAVVPVNGDLYYRSMDGIRSLTQAIRYFQQPGNTPLSREVSRILDQDDRSLLRFCSGIEFNNRLLMTCAPYQTPYGVAHKGVVPLNFDLLSMMEGKLPPAWEGVWEGLNIMQMWKGDFGGLERAFALAYSEENNALEIWEISSTEIFDTNTHGESRISWAVESPSFTWERPFTLKELDTIELWVDKLYGTVEFYLYFRPDQYPCWLFWHQWEECSARNECELPEAPADCTYAVQSYRQLYKATMIMPKPPAKCTTSGRPANKGYTFQFRLVIKGQCRIRGLVAHAFEAEKQPYLGKTC